MRWIIYVNRNDQNYEICINQFSVNDLKDLIICVFYVVRSFKACKHLTSLFVSCIFFLSLTVE